MKKQKYDRERYSIQVYENSVEIQGWLTADEFKEFLDMFICRGYCYLSSNMGSLAIDSFICLSKTAPEEDGDG